jgi:hypothetical protein
MGGSIRRFCLFWLLMIGAISLNCRVESCAELQRSEQKIPGHEVHQARSVFAIDWPHSIAFAGMDVDVVYVEQVNDGPPQRAEVLCTKVRVVDVRYERGHLFTAVLVSPSEYRKLQMAKPGTLRVLLSARNQSD